MIQQKVEIRFEKSEAIRFISHHDLMRALMRAVRRAGLPVRLTEGFNPRPRIVFPVALEVGVASLDEVAEIEFTQWLSLPDIFSRLSSTFPPGLILKTVTELRPVRAGQVPLRMTYRLSLQEAGLEVTEAMAAELLAATTLPFPRPREKGIQNVDLRPALGAIKVDGGELLVEVHPAPRGSARPLEILSLLLKVPLDQVKKVRVVKLKMELRPQPAGNPEIPETSESLEPPETGTAETDPPETTGPTGLHTPTAPTRTTETARPHPLPLQNAAPPSIPEQPQPASL